MAKRCARWQRCAGGLSGTKVYRCGAPVGPPSVTPTFSIVWYSCPRGHGTIVVPGWGMCVCVGMSARCMFCSWVVYEILLIGGWTPGRGQACCGQHRLCAEELCRGGMWGVYGGVVSKGSMQGGMLEVYAGNG